MARRVLRFGDCSLDVAARDLRRAGARVELPPTVFDCIAYLIEHRDRAVGRDELVAAVWGKAAISDTMLGKAILAARRAIGDSAEAQAHLRTIPRFGYHWVGAVDVIDEDDAAEPALAAPEPRPEPAPAPAPRSATPVPATPPPPDPAPAARARRRARIAAAVALALAALAGLAVGLRRGAPALERTAASTRATAVVVPAAVLADAADDWLRLGLMDLLATRLRDGGVAVASSDSVVHLLPAGASADDALARLRPALDADAWIVPAARKSAGAWVVHVELHGRDAPARSAEARADNPIAAADAVARQLLTLLGRTPPALPAENVDLAELLQRIDAARLADRLDDARAAIATAPPALRASADVRERELRIDLRAGALERARDAGAALLADVPAEADPIMHARVLENLCVANLRLNRLDEAEAACDRSIALLEPRDEPLVLGRVYNDRGLVHLRRRERRQALEDFARSRVALKLAGDPLLLAQLDGNEAVVQLDDGRPAEALPILRRTAVTFRRFDLVDEYVTSVVNEVEADLMLLRPLDALQAGDAGWALRARIADAHVRRAFELARAEALAANGRLGEARGLVDALLHEAADDPATIASAYALLAEVELATGQNEAAAAAAQRAIVTTPDDHREGARTRLALDRALRRLGRRGDAAARGADFAAWAQATGEPVVQVHAELDAAEQAAAERRDDDAARLYETAQRTAAGIGSADVVCAAAVSYANYLIDANRL